MDAEAPTQLLDPGLTGQPARPVPGIDNGFLAGYRVRFDEAAPDGRHFVAQAGDRTVDIELERLTARTTRMRVSVKHGWIFRDRATAGEIVAQTEHSVDLLPTVTQKVK